MSQNATLSCFAAFAVGVGGAEVGWGPVGLGAAGRGRGGGDLGFKLSKK